MTNILVSRTCNQSCAYCFASDYLADSYLEGSQPFLPLEAFDSRLEFLDRSEINQVRLLGGEPTLHPDFPELVHRAHLSHRHLLVFSNGWMPEAALQSLESLSPEECTVVINLSAGSNVDCEPARRQVIQRLGLRAQPGYNIYQPSFDLNYLIPLILETGCRRSVRLGLAQPALSASNQYLNPKQYPWVGQRIVQFALQAAREGIKIELDCGFVRCMFSEDDLKILKSIKADMGWHCSPILDIELEGHVFHCFPLSAAWQVELTSSDKASELRTRFSEKFKLYRLAGIYRQCSSCAYKLSQECSGGCLSATMLRFRSQPLHLTI